MKIHQILYLSHEVWLLIKYSLTMWLAYLLIIWVTLFDTGDEIEIL